MSDQQRWDTICNRSGCNTPNLNRLADQGVSFERSYTPVAVCCPARAMLLTGAYCWHNGVLNQTHIPQSVSPSMKPDTVTYAMRLKEVGYQTGYVGKWHADRYHGPQEFGYDQVSAPTCYKPELQDKYNFRDEDLVQVNNANHPTPVSAERNINWPGGFPWPVWREHQGPHEGRECHFVASRGIGIMQEFAAQENPWLLECHFREPHDPFEPHEDFAKRYNWQDVPLPETWHEEFKNKPGMNRKEGATYNELSEEDVRQAIAHYWAYTEELDHQVGRILAALDESGQADNTLVVFTTDHGEMLGNHHQFIKGWQPYEDTYRIPLLARWPRNIPAGKSASQLVQLHDLAHMFCDVGQAAALPYADGVNIRDVMTDPEHAPGRDSILNVYYGCEFLFSQRMVITEQFKYVFNGFDIDELYDLKNDPHEVTNLIDDPQHEQTAKELRYQMYKHMEDFDDPYRGTWLYNSGRYLQYDPIEGKPGIEIR